MLMMEGIKKTASFQSMQVTRLLWCITEAILNKIYRLQHLTIVTWLGWLEADNLDEAEAGGPPFLIWCIGSQRADKAASHRIGSLAADVLDSLIIIVI